jgi:superoxide dismutase, Cu-Zn family
MSLFNRTGRFALLAGAAVAGALYTRTAATPLSASPAPVKPLKAICVLTPDNNSNVTGVVRFSQVPGEKTKISATVRGLKDGCHGFHIHSLGNLSNGCTSAGGHFNPFNKEHGGPEDENRHVGDLGNLHSENGIAVLLDREDRLIELSGPYSIIGRSVIVHADKDDFGRGGFPDSKTTGHAGARVACGVIGIDE